MDGSAAVVEENPRARAPIVAMLPLNAKVSLERLKSKLKRAKRIPVKFPPSSWNLVQSESDVSDAATSPEPPPKESLESAPKETTEPTPIQPIPEEPTPTTTAGQDASGDVVEPSLDTQAASGSGEDSMSATSIARRIQSLLSSLPPFYSISPSGSLRLPKGFMAQDTQDATTPSEDSMLYSLLSSASIMNGSLAKGRESVWSILEKISHPPNNNSLAAQGTGQGQNGGPSEDNVDSSSLMICCPLFPDENTEVEIAESEIVSINTELPEEPPPTPKPLWSIWPFTKVKRTSTAIHFQATAVPVVPSPKVTQVRVWIPSRTKVSFQAAWWGYRLYLPPPVMAVLNDSSIEAAKRAAMIATVLAWLVTHIPTEMLPPQLQAIVGVAKGIVPLIGYVSGFIAWAWSTIQSFDKGQGVILSATWLLPIALIPGTWNYVPPTDNSGNPPTTTPNPPPGPPQTPHNPPTPPPKDPAPSPPITNPLPPNDPPSTPISAPLPPEGSTPSTPPISTPSPPMGIIPPAGTLLPPTATGPSTSK